MARVKYYDKATSEWKYADGNTITIDSAISATSTNPVQNKVVKTYVDNELSGKAPTSHNQSASTITQGTLAGKVNANASAVTSLALPQIRNIEATTVDLTPGTTALSSGDIVFVYE